MTIEMFLYGMGIGACIVVVLLALYCVAWIGAQVRDMYYQCQKIEDLKDRLLELDIKANMLSKSIDEIILDMAKKPSPRK